jgi:hypothetical protein
MEVVISLEDVVVKEPGEATAVTTTMTYGASTKRQNYLISALIWLCRVYGLCMG